MRRGLLLAVVAAVAIFACSNSYEEDVAPAIDAGADADATPSPELDSGSSDSAVVLPDLDAGDAGHDAEIDAPYNPCDAGFEPGTAGSGCVVANPIKDPSFQTGIPWSKAYGAEIQTTSAGPDDLGVARLGGVDVTYGRVSQTITLPSTLNDIPLAITTVASVKANLDKPFVGFPSLGITLDGRAVYEWTYGLRPGGTTRATIELCLGEAVLFGPHEIAFRGISRTYERVDLDKVAIVASPTCPPRAVVANGDFENNTRWSVDGDVAIEDGVGLFGTRGLHFKDGTTTSTSHAFQSVSVPSASMASPALSFRVIGTGTYQVALDFHPIASGHVTDSTVKICMPDWVRGTVADLSIGNGLKEPSLEGPERTEDFVIDNVMFVDDPACKQSTVVANGDFEKAGSWYAGYGIGYSVTAMTGDAHGGSGYLRLASNPLSCDDTHGPSVLVSQTVGIPEHDPTVTGPRVSFWYRRDPGVNTTTAYAMVDTDLPAAAKWTKITQCLTANPPGTRAEIRFELSALSAPCSSSTVDIDDVTIDTDPTCKY